MSHEPEARIATSRDRVEARLAELRSALARSTGGRLAGRVWVLPLIAAAAGFGVARAMKRKRSPNDPGRRSRHRRR